MKKVLLVLVLGLVSYQYAERIHNIKVVSDKVEDCTTMDAVQSWMIKPGMSDKEKALAIWDTCVKFRHQTTPPNEFRNDHAHDIIKTMNVYGYGQCCCVSSHMASLARLNGLKAQGRIVTHHSVPELWWDNAWHYLDASLVCYGTGADGHILSVDEMIQVYKDYMQAHPDFKPDRHAPKKDFPIPFSTMHTARDHDGMLPAMIHTVQGVWSCFDGKNNGVFEYTYSEGYTALFSLRHGEKLIRNWSNKGLHVNMHDGGSPGPVLKATMDHKELQYQRERGDLGNNRVGNGEHIYTVPFNRSDWQKDTWSLVNTAPVKGIVAKTATGTAEAVFRMNCPYVYLTGKINIAGTGTAKTEIKILVSTDNNGSWKEAGTLNPQGNFEESIDISTIIFRRYDYLVNFTITGGGAIKGLTFQNDIQHSQRALPALTKGKNTITVQTGPATETLTIEPSPNADRKNKMDHISAYNPSISNAKLSNNGVWATAYGKLCHITFPITTPGAIKAVRFGGAFRARGKKDGIKLQLSFDDGKTWITAEDIPGPFAGYCKYTEFTKVPAGRKEVLVRYNLVLGNNTTGMFHNRIDVDYESKAGRAPLKITYEWDENGTVKKHEYKAKGKKSNYTINCQSKPKMKSIVVEVE